MGHRMDNVHGHSIYERSEPAITVLAKALSISNQDARRGLQALVKAGYVVAPREPTNSMLLSYLCSYGQSPERHSSVLKAVAKAKRRWQAMAKTGVAIALSVHSTPTYEIDIHSDQAKALDNIINSID